MHVQTVCFHQLLLAVQILISTIPDTRMNISQKLRILCFPFIVIFSVVPVALDSQENVLISSVDMSLLADPHLLYVPSYGPTDILKLLS